MDKFLKINQGKEDEMYAKLEAKYGLVIPKPPAPQEAAARHADDEALPAGCGRPAGRAGRGASNGQGAYTARNKRSLEY